MNWQNPIQKKTDPKKLKKVKDDIKAYQELHNDWFDEYKSLGGKKNKKEYRENLEIFFDETYEIFIDGNPIKHESRTKAGYAVMKEAKITVEEYNLIFESVDNVTSYT